MMKVLILGGDGYLGWPTAMHLASNDFEVCLVDSLAKRQWEESVGVSPLFPIPTFHDRVKKWNSFFEKSKMEFHICDIAENRHLLYKIIDEFYPDAIVHYAEQPSAPFSHIDADRVLYTQRNNVMGTLNLIMAVLHTNKDCHIIKLGTMGEYGTPNIDIEEGWLDVCHNGREDRVLYPKNPGSWYHLSKVHDSHNLEFATRVWGLRVTDLNQGIVYGTDTDESWLHSDFALSFHYDQYFGTAINRFLCQAATGMPLTVYGGGSQTRGWLNIIDTLRCVRLAIENPAGDFEFRVMNQFTQQFSVEHLAAMIKDATECKIEHIPNPRVEQEDHYYNAKHSALEDLGLDPVYITDSIIKKMYSVVKKYSDNIDTNIIMPTVRWRR